ncbi:MAG: hypothetical protein RR185_01715 [Angelakisella sp.]
MADDLLEQLAVLMHCGYLSDVHNRSRDDLLRAISSIDAEQYSLSEWNQALSYITKHNFCVTDIAQLHDAVKDAYPT